MNDDSSSIILVGNGINRAFEKDSKGFVPKSEKWDFNGMSYFWLCFFLGLPGMILVAALPDGKRSNDSSPKSYSAADTTTWTCKNCSQVNPMTKITCSGCGKYR